MAPPRLDHADPGVLLQIAERAQQEVLRRHEVGVEDGDESAAGLLQAGVERAGLESGPVDAMQVVNIESARRMAADGEVGDLGGLVG